MAVKLGWKAGAEQVPPGDLLEFAAAAEEAGFDALAISDHFHPWSEEGQACFAWTWLGAAAVKTKKMLLGTSVTCPILRYHPAIIAQAAATLAAMAPGRVYLGVGTGEALNEYSAVADWPEYETRQAMLVESMALMRELWSGEEVTFEGDFYETKKARLYTRTDEPIPIYISSMVPASADFAGKYGDGLVTTGGNNIDKLKQVLKEFKKGARDAGKDPAKLQRLIEVNVAYTDDADLVVKETMKYWAGTSIAAMFTERLYTPAQSAENGKVVGRETILNKGCISANPEDHIQFARRLIDLGIDQIYFHSVEPDQKAFLKAYGREVLPALREYRRAK